jgi:hypothetical protein
MESDNFPKKDTVMKAYFSAPFPDKYDNHSISEKTFNPNNYNITDADRAASGTKKKGLLGSLAKGLATDATGGIVDTSKKDMPLIINKYFIDKKVANKLVAKWFDRQDDGSFDMNLIGARGSYNASEMDADIAKGSSRGVSSLADAGEELLNNTFVVVNRLNFKANEPTAAAVRDAAKESAAKMKIPMAQQAAIKAADLLYAKTKDGYSVWVTSYLYKLVWNDSISAVFYNNLWIDKKNLDPTKKEAFDKTDIFKLALVGSDNASALVLFKSKGVTEDKIIDIATVRALDAVYTKLQKNYDVFKPKTPLFTGDPITAKIGMKEGLEGGEKFEVLEQTQDQKTGLTKYVRKGTISVDKNLVWDNRYDAGQAPEDSTATNNVKLDRTTFNGGKGYYPGMLIRQMK